MKEEVVIEFKNVCKTYKLFKNSKKRFFSIFTKIQIKIIWSNKENNRIIKKSLRSAINLP